jgi:CRISPR-associated protein Cas1
MHPELRDLTETTALNQDLHVEVRAPFLERTRDKLQERARAIIERRPGLGQRSSPFHLAGNRNAAHPVNAILNYAYTVLESGLRIKAIADGYDPTIGLMHEGRDGSSKFVFDLMEPERPKVDRAVLEFIKASVFNPADFTIRSDGVVRLNPQLARAVVAGVAA